MRRRDDTICASVGIDCDSAYGAVMPPLHLSANFSFAGFGEKRAYDYSRSANPTRDLLGSALAELEQGAGAVVTSSGMAALDLVLSLLPSGALVAAPHDCYGGTWRLLTARAKQGAIRVVFVDQGNAEAVGSVFGQAPALLLIETPSNPLLRVVDITLLSRIAKGMGTRVLVDNTFLSPVSQKPILLGADFVVHSTTKYLNGHSDVVGGAVIAAHRDDVERLVWWANATGVTGSPFDAWLTLRGLRTLSVRMERQQQSAGMIAERLSRHPMVMRAHYPGLESHPGFRTARRQQTGFGAIISFELAAEAGDVAGFVNGLELFTLAESLGGVESLIAHPATMTHASMSVEARAAAKISERLIRLSIGLEHVDDLWGALERALNACASAKSREVVR